MHRYLKPAEMAEQLGLSVEQLKEQTNRDGIPFLALGTTIRYDPFEVMALFGRLTVLYPWHSSRPRLRFTYLIHADGTKRYKVGQTFDPQRRIVELNCGSPFTLRLLTAIPWGVLSEEEFHSRYADRRVKGEWFEFKKKSEALEAFGDWTIEKCRRILGGPDAG